MARTWPVEFLPDGFHVLILHGDAVLDEVGCVFLDAVLVNQHVDDHAADRDVEFTEPADETGNDRDGQRLGQGDEEERGQAVVGEQGLGAAHALT